MELIKANFTILDQHPGIQGIYEQAELPGRICYGSQDRIKPGSAEPFINGLMKSNHGAPLEHGTVYLHLHADHTNTFSSFEYPSIKMTGYYNWGEAIGYIGARYHSNKYSRSISKFDGDNKDVYITTNLRVMFENGWLDDLQWQCEPTEFHEKRITVQFTTDIGVSREFNRHRNDSMNEGSTRFCNLTKDKFGGGNIGFIQPEWCEDAKPIDNAEHRAMCRSIYLGEDQDDFSTIDYWLFSLKTSEYCYNNLIRLGWAPEQARGVLPLALKTPLIHTAFVSDWIHFFNLRALGTTGRPHPQAKELAEPLMNEFIERGLIKFDENNKLIMYNYEEN